MFGFRCYDMWNVFKKDVLYRFFAVRNGGVLLCVLFSGVSCYPPKLSETSGSEMSGDKVPYKGDEYQKVLKEDYGYKDSEKLEFLPVNNVKKPYVTDVLKDYVKPTMVGLENVGATCFMNATLQCLSQTERLVRYFLDKKNEERINNNNITMKKNEECQLSPSFLEVIKGLWNKDCKSGYYDPSSFRDLVEKMNPLFEKGKAGDPKDFIIFILEQLHKELSKNVAATCDEYNKMIRPNKFFNQYDKKSAFSYFFENFTKNCSIVTDTFFGTTETMRQCVNCKLICYNYEVFNCLIFPLDEVRKFVNNMSMNNMNNMFMPMNGNRVSLRDCFLYNGKTELFCGEDQNYCNRCKGLHNSGYTSRIYTEPNVLVLILNRGKGNIYNVGLDFGESLDITDFVVNKNGRKVYELYGVVTHFKGNDPKGLDSHFMASCKNPIDNEWYKYNDNSVTKVKNVQRDVIEFGTPYILFYKKREK